jgi:hypothetical protein
MKRVIKVALLAATLAPVPVIGAAPAYARAQIGVTVDLGNIAFAYTDGYWDRDHHWHRWRNAEEERSYRQSNRAHFYDHRHDRDHDRGWRDHDRYWSRG